MMRGMPVFFVAWEEDDGTWVVDDIVGPYNNREEAKRVARRKWDEAKPSELVLYRCEPEYDEPVVEESEKTDEN